MLHKQTAKDVSAIMRTWSSTSTAAPQRRGAEPLLLGNLGDGVELGFFGVAVGLGLALPFFQKTLGSLFLKRKVEFFEVFDGRYHVFLRFGRSILVGRRYLQQACAYSLCGVQFDEAVESVACFGCHGVLLVGETCGFVCGLKLLIHGKSQDDEGGMVFFGSKLLLVLFRYDE